MKHGFLTLFALYCFCGLSQDCDDTPALNLEIVQLTEKKVKKKVGRGECWDLAAYVLDETGAEWDHFEQYGRLIDPAEECIMPGDIIQFEKIKLKWKDGNMTLQESMGHHTAIVVQVINANEIMIAHQNTAEFGRKVGVSSLVFDRIVKGKLYIYRPIR